MGFGEYEMGDIDEGKYVPITFGLRTGIKLGGLLLGGEYNEGGVDGKSEKLSVSDADRIRYPSLDGARQQTWGWSLGLAKHRFLLWYTYFGYNKIKHNTDVASVPYNHAFEGDGHRIELSFRVWKLLYIGAHYRIQTFDRYSSTHPSDSAIDQPLDHKLKTTDYGGSFSIVLPLSFILDDFYKKLNL